MTVSVRDSAALLDATLGADADAIFKLPPPERPYRDEVARPPGRLRVAVVRRPILPGVLHLDCAAALDDAAALLAALGHDVEEVDLGIDPMQFARDFFLHVCVDTAASLRLAPTLAGRPLRRREFETNTWLCGMLGRLPGGLDLALARQRLLEIGRRAEERLGPRDVLLTPTLALPPVKHGALDPPRLERLGHDLIKTLELRFLLRLPGVVDATVAKVFAFMPYTPLANVAGQPSMNLPLHWNADGLPIGVTVTAGIGREDVLFRLAGQVETARPWAGRVPPES
jgi:amidase